MSIRNFQRAAAAGQRRRLPMILDRSVLAFALLCDGIVVQTG
jgi:hypothetical protein